MTIVWPIKRTEVCTTLHFTSATDDYSLERAMTFRDIAGLIFCGAGVTIGAIAYRLLGLEWYFAACGLIAIGVCLLWSADRDRKMRAAASDGPGD